MKTPIYDFVTRYSESDTVRMHMPGHKGKTELERFDITEVTGADSLYHAEGIIAESEANATELFGVPTYYTTEGSSHAIRAMLYLVSRGKKDGLILAARNVHRSFISAVAMLGLDVEWLSGGDYLSQKITPEMLAEKLQGMTELPCAVYVTSPDYLGGMLDIRGLSVVAHSFGIPLLVDAAHGSYLRFLETSLFPTDLGADICASSAHKTLPVLTGGAYLHISEGLAISKSDVKAALSLFGSTSPSYLILSSLDRANATLSGDYRENLSTTVDRLNALKLDLIQHGYELCGNEPMKLAVKAKAFGYYGYELKELLGKEKIEVEFADSDFVVMMPSPSSFSDIERLRFALLTIPKKESISTPAPVVSLPTRAISVREAVMSLSEAVSVEDALGRVCAIDTVGCPPAVPVIVPGEVVDEGVIEVANYYGIGTLTVIKN